jgi:nucleotide-binding universal stress UspA family protein
MSATTKRHAEPPAWLGTIFDRIVCGVDGTESSRAALVQAKRLLPARRILELVSVVEETSAAWSEPPARSDIDRRREAAQSALRNGRHQCPRARSALFFGDPGPQLVSAAREVDATLVVIGAPPSGRLGAFVLGGAGTYVLHNAPCSLLIARRPVDEDAFPRSIVVGHDGSPAAVEAAIVAQELAQRFAAQLRIVVATGGDPVQFDSLPPDEKLEWSSARPIDALEAASDEADLLVVGSSGLQGPRGLGSVSERIGHLARCSVLVLRDRRGSGAEPEVADEVPDPEC